MNVLALVQRGVGLAEKKKIATCLFNEILPFCVLIYCASFWCLVTNKICKYAKNTVYWVKSQQQITTGYKMNCEQGLASAATYTVRCMPSVLFSDSN